MSSTEDRLIPIDTEHSSQLFVPVLALGVAIVVHVVGLAVFSGLLEEIASPICAMLLIDSVVFIAAWSVIDRFARRLRPSPRFATLNGEALVITDGRHRPAVVTRFVWDQTVNVKAWKFAINRRTRVPKGWYCLALQLVQDDSEAIVYTFMNPQLAEAAIGYGHFVKLQARQGGASGSDLDALTEQRRLLKLENLRWQDGAEISPEDFNALLAVMQRRVPAWS